MLKNKFAEKIRNKKSSTPPEIIKFTNKDGISFTLRKKHIKKPYGSKKRMA